MARQEGIRFKAGKDTPWLLEAKIGFQYVALVICHQLPVEEKYYQWLAFAPADSPNWKQLTRKLWREDWDDKLLDTIRRMRPKEYDMTVNEILDEMRANGEITPEEDAEMNRELEQIDSKLAARAIDDLLRLKSRKLREILSRIPIEERLAGMKPEELLVGLKPEELLDAMTTDQRQELLKKVLAEQNKEGQP